VACLTTGYRATSRSDAGPGVTVHRLREPWTARALSQRSLRLRRTPGRLSRSSRRRWDSVIESVNSGGSIAAPLKDTPIFPAMVAQMIAVGEETGNLDTMLTKVADC
jgi:hypothetical protein